MMQAIWERGKVFLEHSKHFKAGLLVMTGLAALYIGAIRPREEMGGVANSRATGLAGYKAESTPLFQRGISGGQLIPKPMTAASLSMSPEPAPQAAEDERKMVRTSSIDMVVKKPAEAAGKIQAFAEQLGGFLVSSQISGGEDASSGSLTVRVPAARFDEARDEIRKLGLTVENERIDAQDVTRQYVDDAANLRNLKAEEQQYLSILKQAHTVKDTLDVSEKLSDVRGQIEQHQAEFDTLSKQIETVSITVSLRAEADARVFGLNWRPLYQMKFAMREGLDGLANYASTMIEFVFFLPTVLLWFATITLGAALGWRVLRWVGRRAFKPKMAATEAQG
jgi:hypothetical protein